MHTYIHYTTLHWTALHYITWHYITLHYITLHYIHTPFRRDDDEVNGEVDFHVFFSKSWSLLWPDGAAGTEMTLNFHAFQLAVFWRTKNEVNKTEVDDTLAIREEFGDQRDSTAKVQKVIFWMIHHGVATWVKNTMVNALNVRPRIFRTHPPIWVQHAWIS